MRKIGPVLALVYLTVSQTAWADVIISPRVSYYFDNTNQRSSGLDSAATVSPEAIAASTKQLQELFGPNSSVNYTISGTGSQSNQLAVPMYGLSATFGSDDVSVTLTGMYGKGHTQFRAISTVVQQTVLAGSQATDNGNFNFVGKGESKRYDFEATLQKRLNERFGLIGGVRYERVTGVANGTTNITISNNASNLAALLTENPISFKLNSASSTSLSKGTSELFSARAGINGFIPFSRIGTVFLTGMIHVSYEPTNKNTFVDKDNASGAITTKIITTPGETSIGPDLAVGAQFALSQKISFDIRYRATVYFPVSGPRNFKDPRVNHGLNMGMNFRF